MMKDNNNAYRSRPEASPESDHSDGDNNNELQSNRNDMQSITDLISTYEGSPFKPDFSERVIHAIKQDASRIEHHAKIYSLSFPTVLKAAAVIVMLIAAGFLFWNQPQIVEAPLGTMTSVSLPDGSTVLLNSGSKVSFRPFEGKNTRHVELTGEGFFDITSSDKPFIVETFNAEVQVLGTRFSVTSWPGSLSGQTQVTLEEGQVNVQPTGLPSKATLMAPQQSLTVFSDASISEVQHHTADQTQHMLSWRSGGYIFQDMPLGAIVQELQRRGNLKIYVPDELLFRPVTYFEPTPLSIEEVLEVLSQAHSFNYSKTANGFTLSTLGSQN